MISTLSIHLTPIKTEFTNVDWDLSYSMMWLDVLVTVLPQLHIVISHHEHLAGLVYLIIWVVSKSVTSTCMPNILKRGLGLKWSTKPYENLRLIRTEDKMNPDIGIIDNLMVLNKGFSFLLT